MMLKLRNSSASICIAAISASFSLICFLIINAAKIQHFFLNYTTFRLFFRFKNVFLRKNWHI